MVVGKETVRRCPSPSEVEGVEEKLTAAELKPQREHEGKYWSCWCGGLEVGSSQEEGWGSFHWEVEVVRAG